MSDQLREALENWERAKFRTNRYWQRKNIDRLADAARRFLALTETGTLGTIGGASVIGENTTEVYLRVDRDAAREWVRNDSKLLVIPADYLTEEKT